LKRVPMSLFMDTSTALIPVRDVPTLVTAAVAAV